MRRLPPAEHDIEPLSVRRAARLLGISHSTVYRRLQKAAPRTEADDTIDST